jgi:hypothetical protein
MKAETALGSAGWTACVTSVVRVFESAAATDFRPYRWPRVPPIRMIESAGRDWAAAAPDFSFSASEIGL